MPASKWIVGSTGDRNEPLRFLGLLLAIGALLLLAYGLLSPAKSSTGTIVLLVVALAGSIVGGGLGFLFGIPRFDYGDRPAAGPQKPDEGSPVALPDTGAGTSTRRIGNYKPSSNLEEIADWLTKIIVGLGLINLTKLGPALQKLSEAITAECPGSCSNPPFAAAVVIYSVTGGLLFGYLWTRLHYSKMAAQSDVEVHQTLEERDAARAAAYGIGRGARFAGESVEPAVASEIDLNKGKFGGSPIANGRVLRAAIEPSELKEGLYRITLSVSSLNPARPLKGAVTFHLHPTFLQSVVTREAVDGAASLAVIAYGTFTVGAVADGGRTHLELDLATHPEAPQDFRSR